MLPGGSGLQELTALDDRRFGKLLAQFHQLERFVDVMLLDTGSGLAKSVTNFVHAADETILVTTPEPHAITDAYALIKVRRSGPGRCGCVWWSTERRMKEKPGTSRGKCPSRAGSFSTRSWIIWAGWWRTRPWAAPSGASKIC